MAKGDRPVKIKRYGDIREKNIKRAGKAKRIFGFLALLLVLFAVKLTGTSGWATGPWSESAWGRWPRRTAWARR